LKSAFLPQEETKGSTRRLPLLPLEAALPILKFRFFVNNFLRRNLKKEETAIRTES
jgi:hypothetical protein